MRRFGQAVRLDGWTEYFNREGWETAFAKRAASMSILYHKGSVLTMKSCHGISSTAGSRKSFLSWRAKRRLRLRQRAIADTAVSAAGQSKKWLVRWRDLWQIDSVIKFSKNRVCQIYRIWIFCACSFQKSAADLGLSYSQGFNPHPKMSFAQPLSLGYAGRSELIELETHVRIRQRRFSGRCRDRCRRGLRFSPVSELPAEVKSLAAAADSAAYRSGS